MEERIEEKVKEMNAKDGYVNLPASLGEASPLQSSGDYIRNGISGDYELLTTLYRENWIAKRIIDMPCEDMTREWYTISTELRQDLIDKIKKVEAKHNVKGEITNALRWARLYGGSLALMVIKGQEDMLDEPLDYGMIMPDSFKGLLVLDMVTGITPSIELEDDMDDPDFGLPKYYDVVLDAYSGEMVRLHHSRVLRFVGRDLPPQEEIRENYWGASELEHIYEELQKRNATSANIAQLVFQANTRVLKMADYGEVIGMGTNKQKKQVLSAIEAQNRLLTSFGVQVMGTEDNMESHPYSFSGISEVYESFMMDMAGAANIPATRLFGRSPQGMNATGESDMNNYYESIAQNQERTLRPALERLLPVICMSLFGAIPDDMEIVFEPIATTTPEQRSNITGQFTSTVIEAFSAGLIGRKTALMELKEMGKDIGSWTKISDETIAEADDEVDNGEMGGEMPPEGGMTGMEGMMPPEMAEEGSEEEPEEPDMPKEEPEEPNPKVIPMKKERDNRTVNFNQPGLSKKVVPEKRSRFIGDFFHRIFKGRGRDEEAWRTTEEGNHFKLETETGEIKAGLGTKGSGGRFLGKKSSGGGVPKKESVSFTTPKQVKKLNSIQKKIAHYKNEQSFIIGKNGEILAQSKGDKHSVGMSVGTKREFQTGNISLHNHPAGGTFSPDDLNDFGFGATEIHVSGPDGDYCLKNVKWDTKERYNGWVPMKEALEKAVPSDVSFVDLKKKAQQSPEVQKIDSQIKEISDHWVKMRNAGASDEELKKFVDESGYDELSTKRKNLMQSEMRRLETEPFHKFYEENAAKYGFEYSFKKRESAKDGNPNHDPENGQFTEGSGGSSEESSSTESSSVGSSGRNHPTQDEFIKAAGGESPKINKAGMRKHLTKENAEKQAKKEYEKALKKYKKDLEKGKEVTEPEFRPKSYFAEGIDGFKVLSVALKAIDNGVCKWYNKKGGEIKAMVQFKKDIGFSATPESDEMVSTNKVMVTYSRTEGFHCYPYER